MFPVPEGGVYKQLGQIHPTDTNSTTIYSPPSGLGAVVLQLVICNTDSTARTFDIYFDDDGTTANTTTALYLTQPIAAKGTIIVDAYFAMNNSDGALRAASSSGSTVTYTAFGVEYQV